MQAVKESGESFRKALEERSIYAGLESDDLDVMYQKLNELYKHPADKALATPRVVDRVGKLLWNADSEVRTLAVRTYVALLNKNSGLDTKEREDTFLALRKENDPEIRRLFIMEIRAPLKGFEKLDFDLRVDLFKFIIDPDPRVREEARVTVAYKFGMSEKTVAEFSKQMLKFSFVRERNARNSAKLIRYVEQNGFDADVVFSGIAKATNGMMHYEENGFNFILDNAKNLLVHTSNFEKYDECLKLSCELHKEISSRMIERNEEHKRIRDKMFVDWLPDVARESGYKHLAADLEELLKEIRKSQDMYEADLLKVFLHDKGAI